MSGEPDRLRLATCVAAWPDAESGEYDPSCCRFPKSCSPYPYPETPITDGDLEPAPDPAVAWSLNLGRMIDLTRLPSEEPCPDCGRTYLNGERVTWTAPVDGGGSRIVWAGCCDCWKRRTDLVPPDDSQRVRSVLFNDITHWPAPGELLRFSARRSLADWLWEKGWRRPVLAEDVTERRDDR